MMRSTPAAHALLMLYTVLLHLPALLHPAINALPGFSFAGGALLARANAGHLPLELIQITDLVLKYLGGLFLSLIVSRYNLPGKGTLIPALMYITIGALLPQWLPADAESIGAMTILLSFYNLLQLNEGSATRNNIFFTGFYLGLGCLFYLPSAIFGLVIVAGLLGRRSLVRDVLLALTGLVLPFYFLGIGYYWNGHLGEYFNLLWGSVSKAYAMFSLGVVESGLLAGTGAIALLGYSAWRRGSDARVVRTRRPGDLALIHLGLAALFTPLVSADKSLYLQLTILPLALLGSFFFSPPRLRYWHSLFFTLMVATLLLLQYRGVFMGLVG